MRSSYKKAVIAVSAAMASLGALRMSSAQTYVSTTIDSASPTATIDGWNITVGSNVALSVLSNSSTILIDKTATFSSSSQEIPITFSAANSSPLGTIDFEGEELTNQTGSTITGFTFQLLGTGSLPTFTQAFSAPAGATVNQPTPQEVTYSGLNIAQGAALDLGSDDQSSNNLDINADSDFTLKEIAESSGGGGGGTSAVPLPAAAWQSMAGLTALGLFGIARRAKRRIV